jgi:hypothetical protein
VAHTGARVDGYGGHWYCHGDSSVDDRQIS